MRKHPLFLIDRSRSESYPNDYIVCTDDVFGFIAQVILMPTDEMYQAFLSGRKKIAYPEFGWYAYPLKKGAVILLCLHFFYEIEQNGIIKEETSQYIKFLLKKGLKKYLHGEKKRISENKYGIEVQIRQQKLTIQRAKNNYADLVNNGGKETADDSIAIAEATLRTLEEYRNNLGFSYLKN